MRVRAPRRAEVGSADAARGPQVNAGAAVSGARIPTTVLPADVGGGHFVTAKYGYASFNWGLDLWGGKRAAWEAAVGAAKAADIDSRAARIELSANVARAYVQLGYAYAQQDVADAELKRASDARELTRQRVGRRRRQQAAAQAGRCRSGPGPASAGGRRSARSMPPAPRLSVLLGKGPDRGLSIERPGGAAAERRSRCRPISPPTCSAIAPTSSPRAGGSRRRARTSTRRRPSSCPT